MRQPDGVSHEPGEGVPRALRGWFLVHFWADIVVALPLFVAPEWFLRWFGWTVVDPATARLVAAALFAIGIQSLLGRGEGREAFRAMLNLKIIWSFFALAGLVWFQLEGGPAAGWLFVAIFGGFHVVWLYWRARVGSRQRPGSGD